MLFCSVLKSENNDFYVVLYIFARNYNKPNNKQKKLGLENLNVYEIAKEDCISDQNVFTIINKCVNYNINYCTVTFYSSKEEVHVVINIYKNVPLHLLILLW